MNAKGNLERRQQSNAARAAQFGREAAMPMNEGQVRGNSLEVGWLEYISWEARMGVEASEYSTEGFMPRGNLAQ